MHLSEEQLHSLSMKLSDEQLLSMTRSEVLELSDEEKMFYLYSLQVRHRRLEDMAKDIVLLMSRYNETNIIAMIGATGVGKTTFSIRLLKQLIRKFQSQNGAVSSTVPVVFIAAPANGDKSISWATVYQSALRATNEILTEKKQANVINDGLLTVQPKRYGNLAALRDALESMLKNRDVRVLVIDEAFHLLRFGNYSAVMDTLKSLADRTGVKLLLLGSYNLFDLVSDYGQVARRAEIVHFMRYNRELKDDIDEFDNIVSKIQQRWPCEIVPNFTAISPELMEASLGCIGLLKAILLQALSMQLENKGKWTPMFMAKAAKSMKLLDVIKREIQNGEEKVRGATYGETLFSGKILESIIVKMGGKAA
jgi:hypothetical protein